jgi:hypothetical protein
MSGAIVTSRVITPREATAKSARFIAINLVFKLLNLPAVTASGI